MNLGTKKNKSRNRCFYPSYPLGVLVGTILVPLGANVDVIIPNNVLMAI